MPAISHDIADIIIRLHLYLHDYFYVAKTI